MCKFKKLDMVKRIDSDILWVIIEYEDESQEEKIVHVQKISFGGMIMNGYFLESNLELVEEYKNIF